MSSSTGPFHECTAEVGTTARGRRSGATSVMWALAGAVLLGVCLTPLRAGAQAESGPDSIVVFKLEGDQATDAMRTELTAAVREQVRQHEGYTLVNDDPVVLSDVVVVLGCKAQTTNCLEKAADHFDADYLIFGKLEDAEERTRVSVRLFDPKKGKYVRSFGRVIAKMEEPYERFRGEVDDILTADGSRSEATLNVHSDVKGATVKLNGETIGSTPVENHELDPGTYRVEVTADDDRSWSTEVDVEKGGEVRIRAPLREPEPQPRASRREGESSSSETPAVDRSGSGSDDRQGRSNTTWGPWLAIGFGGVALVGSGIEAAVMQKATRDLRNWRSTHRSPPDGCAEEECEIIERGENAELGHRILLGVGGASVAGGLLWLWLQSLGDNETEAARRMDVSVSPRGVSVGWEW